jgi:hypothetical protein
MKYNNFKKQKSHHRLSWAMKVNFSFSYQLGDATVNADNGGIFEESRFINSPGNMKMDYLSISINISKYIHLFVEDCI